MTYKQNSMINTRTQQQTLGLHTNSHNIIKTQPKIRIIHIHAPEIINTDVANFRELVQSLTGMPQPGQKNRGQRGRGKPKKIINRNPNNNNNININVGFENKSSMVNTKLEVMMGPTTSTTTGSSSSPSSSFDEHNYHNQNDNQEFWRMTTMDQSNTTNGGYLTGLPEFDDHLDLSMFNVFAPADAPSQYFNSLDKY